MFNYLFYRIYRFQYKIIGENSSSAAASSVCTIALLFNINVFSVWLIIDVHANLISSWITNFNTYFNTDIATPIAVSALVLIIVYCTFYYKKKYERIIQKIQDSSKQKRSIANALAILYQIVTFVVLIIALMYF